MTVRVIRVLEYNFPDFATAEQQLSNTFVPANGVKIVGKVAIRSATTWPEEITDEGAEIYNPEGEDYTATTLRRAHLFDLAECIEEVQPPMKPEKIAEGIRNIAGGVDPR